MDKWIDEFLEFKLHNKGRSERTVQVYKLALSRLHVFLGDKDPLKVTQDELLAFTGPWLHKHGLKDPASRRTHIAATREFYKWLHERSLTKVNMGQFIHYPQKAKKIPRVMTLSNAAKLMWEPNFERFEGVRDGAMLSLLAGCGLRVSGLVALNQSNVLQIEVDKEPRLALKVIEKGNKERVMPIPKEADLMLRLYLEHEELKEIDRRLPNGDQVLFVSTMNRMVTVDEYRGENRRLNRRAVRQMIRKYGQQAGIPEDQLHPHAMRHLFGTELTEDDVTLLVTQQLMGHADPKSTEIYTHIAINKLTREVDRAGPLAKMKTPVSDLIAKMSGKR